MNDLLPDSILVVDGRRGRRYRLPLQSIPQPRRGRGLRSLRWAFGGFVVGVAGWVLLAWSNAPNDVPFSWPFVVGVAGTAVAIIQGLNAAEILIRSTVIEVSTGTLRVRERKGAWFWQRVRQRGQLRGFALRLVVETDGDAGSTDESRALIEAACEGIQPLPLAHGYPRAWLAPLAAELARHFNVPLTLDGPTFHTPPEGFDATDELPDADTVDRDEAPAGSSVLLQREADELVFDVPPQFLLRNPQALTALPFAAIPLLLGSMAVFVTVGAVAAGKLEFDTLFPLSIGLLFIGVGLSFFFWGVNALVRRARIVVGPDRLRVFLSGGLAGPRLYAWKREELAAVRTGRGETGYKGADWRELEVYTAAGQRIGFLMSRNPAELDWIATVIRRVLDVPAVEQD